MSVKRLDRPLVEKVRIPAIIAVWLMANEWYDPLPAQSSILARFLVFAFAAFVAREMWHTLLATSDKVGHWHEVAAAKIRQRTDKVSKDTVYRLQRLFVWLTMLWVWGSILSTLTDKCEGAAQCVFRTIPLAYENVPTFLMFAIQLALGMMQLAFFFYTMVKVGTYKIIQPGTIQVTFDDVWGQDKARDAVMEQVRILDDSAAIEAAGGYLPKGIVLHGPAGTGKTMLAKAAANASSKPLILFPPGAMASTFVGIAELKVWMLFREIRKQARRHGGVIVFFDEIDSLGSRGGMVEGIANKLGINFAAVNASAKTFLNPPGSEPMEFSGCVPAYDPNEPTNIYFMNQGSQALTTFLAAMDGMEEPRGMLNKMLKMLGFKPIPPPTYRYFMLGATNRIQVLDPALLRAGRLGRKVYVGYPRVDGRKRTYEGYLSKVNHELSDDDVEWVALHDHNGSGASIRDVVNEAVLLTFRDGRETPGLVGFEDVTKAMSLIKFGEPGDMWERDEAVWGVAVHEAGHAVAFHYLNRDRQDIWIASILPRGTKGGFVAPTAKHDDWLLTRNQMLADVQVFLASRVAERIVLGQASNGHGGDGPAATERALKMVTNGHSERMIGSYGKVEAVNDPKQMNIAVESILVEAQHEVEGLLHNKQAHIEAVARLLADKGEIRGAEIHELLDAMDGVVKA